VNSSQTLTAVKASDGLGNVKQTQITSDPQGTVLKDTTYDGVGRVRTVSNPYRSGNDPTSSPGTTTYAYDPLGRKTSETYPDNSVTTTLYFGNAVTVTDATGKARKSISDAFARVTQVFEAPSGPNYETDYTYDALGNLKQVVQNGSHQRNFVYDSLSRLLTSTNPEVGTITYTYDANSNVASKADARNIVITYGYDALNRETSRTYSNGDASVLTTYDQSNCLGLSACQNVGHRTGMTDAAGSDAWSYQVDSANSRSIHREQRTTNGITKTSSYYLDLAGNVTQAVYPTGRVVNYAYDAANRPSAATDGSNGITYATDFQTVPSGCLSGAVCYTPQGTFYALSIGQSSSFTGLSLIHTYNNRLQPQEFKASSSGGYAIDISYNFVDPVSSHNAGHVYGINNNLDTTRSQTFTYDSLNRITGAQTTSTYATSPTHCWGETYSLDAWGNLNSIAGTTNSAYTGCIQESGFSTTADGNNHLPLFSYDPSGNTQNDGSHGYTWNAESQLVQSSPGRLTFTTYGYDGDGRRVSKTRFKTYWYGSGGDILAETDGSGNTTAEYIFFGGKRIAMLPASGSPLYYVEDMLGTSRVNTTNTGAVCYDADFYPYGGETAYTNTCSSPQNYKFEGKERDGETGNDNFGARYYSNRFGRWLSADWSAVPVSVPYANLSNPQTLNLYAMVADDPESFSDLDGHQNNPTPTSNQTLAAAGEACATGSGGNNQHCVTTTEKAQNQRPSLTPEQMREAILNVVGLFTFTALEAASMGGGNSGSTASRQETAAAEIAAETGAETAAARANAIADTYVGKTKGSITIAVTETAEGPRIVSSSENDRGLRPLALAALKQGEIPVEGVGHAEKTGLDAAKRMGLTPTGTAASRPICQECWDAMKALGVAALSVLKSGVI
jgi:RHS repeat-associated protein